MRRAGFEPARPKALAPKASASASSATLARSSSVQAASRPIKHEGDGRAAAFTHVRILEICRTSGLSTVFATPRSADRVLACSLPRV